MIKAPVSLQDLRRRLYIKAKAKPAWRFWGAARPSHRRRKWVGEGSWRRWSGRERKPDEQGRGKSEQFLKRKTRTLSSEETGGLDQPAGCQKGPLGRTKRRGLETEPRPTGLRWLGESLTQHNREATATALILNFLLSLHSPVRESSCTLHAGNLHVQCE